ncbi:MAG: hypothetical protein AB8B55_05485 [Mariniblastus sp.]
MAIDVSGHITEDTVWDSPDGYRIVGDVIVDRLVSLTIEDTRVFALAGMELIVEGTLDLNQAVVEGLGGPTDIGIRGTNVGEIFIRNRSTIAGSNIFYDFQTFGFIEDSSMEQATLTVLSEIDIDDNTFLLGGLTVKPSIARGLDDNLFLLPMNVSLFGDVDAHSQLKKIVNVENYLIESEMDIGSMLSLTVDPGVKIGTTSGGTKNLRVFGDLIVDGASFVGPNNRIIVEDTGDISFVNSEFFGNAIFFLDQSTGSFSDNVFRSGKLNLLSANTIIDNNTFVQQRPVKSNPSLVEELYDNNYSPDSVIEIQGVMTTDAELRPIENVKKFSIESDVNIPLGTTLTVSQGVQILTASIIDNIVVAGMLNIDQAELLDRRTQISVLGTGRLDLHRSCIAQDVVIFEPGSIGDMTRNTFLGSRVVVDGQSDVGIFNNNFSQTQFSLSGPNTEVVDLENNYWGTTDTTAISGLIRDRNDDPALPLADFQPLLDASPTDAIFLGTEGIDNFVLNIKDDRYEISANDNQYSHDARCVSKMILDGLGAGDTVLVQLPDSTDVVESSEGLTTITSVGVSIDLQNFSTMEINSGGGNDEAVLNSSGDGNEIVANPDFISFFGPSSERRVVGFNSVAVDATAGINDTAHVIDSEGDDLFNGGADESEMVYPDSTLRMLGFESILAVSESGGDDLAIIFDSAGDDHFAAEGLNAVMTYASQEVTVEGFAEIEGRAINGGTDTAQLTDTEGNDTLVTNLNDTSLTSASNSVYAESFDSITVTSENGGFDVSRIEGTVGSDNLVALPSRIFFNSSSISLAVVGFMSNEVIASEGLDRATFYDGVGNDVFEYSDDEALFQAGVVKITAVGFEELTAVSSEGGEDRATLTANGKNDFFITRDGEAVLKGAEVDVSLEGFARMSAIGFAGEDANNRAIFWGTSGPDLFVYDRDSAEMVTGIDRSEASGFARVVARGNGGNDTASLADSELNDLFFSRYGQSFFSNDEGTFVSAFDFNQVTARSTDGADVAFFTGSPQEDSFYARPNSSRIEMGELTVTAVDFFEATSRVESGGNDTAYFEDSPERDSFVGTQTYSSLRNGNYLTKAVNYGIVVATSNSADDVAYLVDSAGDDQLFASPDRATLDSANVSLNVLGFDRVNATASTGNDVANFRDSIGDDVYLARPTSALLRGDEFFNFAIGFDRYSAVSERGADIARIFDSTSNDQLYMDTTGVTLRGSDFFLFAKGFERTLAYSIGGNDEAFLIDTEDDDFLSGKASDVWMFSDDYFRFVSGFETVSAGATEGGVDRLRPGDIDFDLTSFGDWI